MIVTLDGPAGSGKSTTAGAVADRLGFHHLESGAFYRALTLAALDADIPPERWPDLSASDFDRLGVRALPDERGYRFFIDDDDATDRLRSKPVDEHVSLMARVPAVRDWLLHRLRDAARGVDLVADGRDMGTVVFPDAELKFFLTASAETRARRRLAQHGLHDPDPGRVAEETRRLLDRDRIDSERDIAPLRRPDDAVVVDTTHLDFDQQVDRIVRLAREHGAGTRSHGGGPRPL
ncbi:MAG: (d)CMP kinase [Gemmatimonadota bacterium]